MATISRKQYDLVRTFVLDEWDPIGVAHDLAGRNEYDAYLPNLCGMMIRGASEEEVFTYMWNLESERLGISGSRERTRECAKRLRHLFMTVG